jgi:hypothetical protein
MHATCPTHLCIFGATMLGRLHTSLQLPISATTVFIFKTFALYDYDLDWHVYNTATFIFHTLKQNFMSIYQNNFLKRQIMPTNKFKTRI